MVKLRKQLRGHLAQGVHEHVQTSPVRHADHDLLHACYTGFLHQFVHRSDEAFSAFQRETLLADVFGVQITLEAFCGCEVLQNVLFLLGVERGLGAHAFHLLLPPTLFVLAGGIHVFSTNRAAVGFAQRIEQLAQAHLLFAEIGIGGVEHRFHVGIGEAVESGVEVRNMVALGALQRIEIGPARANVAIRGNQLLRSRALFAHFRIGAGVYGARGALFGEFGERIDDGQVSHVFGCRAV